MGYPAFRWCMIIAAGLATLASAYNLPAADPGPQAARASQPVSMYVGLRRSSYGLPSKNADDQWWALRAKAFAGQFPGAQPVIIEIVSGYQDDGTTQFGFAKPAQYTGPTGGMAFHKGKLDHERALTVYDKLGVKAILQVEPGNADLPSCLEVAHLSLGHHPCVIGLGVDAEWYFCKESSDKSGRPITDAEAKAWTEKTLALNPAYTLFVKHWQTKNLPPKYRHESLWFLDDSQDFKSVKALVGEFKDWGRHYGTSAVGFQYGYPKDSKWWSKLASPPADIGCQLTPAIGNCCYLFWVDFSADKVEVGVKDAP